MDDLLKKIAQADDMDVEKLLKAVLQRYGVLFPEWEVSVLSLQKNSDRNQQLDQTIALLQKMKTIS